MIARANLALLQIDLESIDLAQQKARDRVPAVGDALLVGAGGLGGWRIVARKGANT